MAVITTKSRKKRPVIAIQKTGHPAAFRKIRCPAKCQGYAVASNTDETEFTCQRCGRKFKVS